MDWTSLPKGTPPRLRELLERCLTKDPRRRLRDIGDARITLEEIRSGKTPGTTAAGETGAAPSRRTLALVAGVAVVLGAILGMALWNGLHRTPARMPMRLAMPLPDRFQIQGASGTPDGRIFVVLGLQPLAAGEETRRTRLYLRSMETGTFDPIPGTEGAVGLFVSPDGRWLAFVAAPSGGQPRLYKKPLDLSTPPAVVCTYDRTWNYAGAWLNSGDFIVTTADGTGFVRISADGSVAPPRKFDFPGFNGRLNVIGSPLPHDRGVLMDAIWYEGNVFCQGTAVMDLKSGKAKILVRDGGNPQYSPTGHLLFTRLTTLFAVPFDLGGLKLAGEPVALLTGMRAIRPGTHAPFGFNGSGTLIYIAGVPTGAERRILVADRSGKTYEWAPGRAAWEYAIQASRAGDRIVGDINNADMITEIWVLERGRSSPYRLATRPGADCMSMALSPDGKEIAYGSMSRSPLDGVYVSALDGVSPPRRLTAFPTSGAVQLPYSWSPDGTTLLVDVVEGGKTSVMRVSAHPAQGTLATPAPLFSDEVNRRTGCFSPDGRFVAYQSNESGQAQVYVDAWNGQGVSGRALLVSPGGGTKPRWAKMGSTLYYHSLDNKVLAVRIVPGAQVTASPPSVVWNLSALNTATAGPGFGTLFDVLPDGNLVFAERAESENEVTHVDVVLNFDRELVQKVRAARK